MSATKCASRSQAQCTYENEERCVRGRQCVCACVRASAMRSCLRVRACACVLVGACACVPVLACVRVRAYGWIVACMRVLVAPAGASLRASRRAEWRAAAPRPLATALDHAPSPDHGPSHCGGQNTARQNAKNDLSCRARRNRRNEP
eukprot:2706306-Pleurochrysis_carterae.AAC.2